MKLFFYLLFLKLALTVFFSTKTAYKEVFNSDIGPIFPPNYTVKYLRYLSRHGSRYPSLKDLTNMNTTLEYLKKHALHYEKFSHSYIFSSVFTDKALSEVGVQELYGTGYRYRQRLKDIFNSDHFSAKDLNFDATCRCRSTKSMLAFMAGLLQINQNTTSLPNFTTHGCENDIKLRFFDFCPHYASLQKCQRKYVEEEDKFLELDFIQEFKKQVNDKFGLPSENQLTSKHLKHLYFYCAYQTMLTSDTKLEGPICRLFDEEMLTAFDYLLDIKNYYKRGHVYKINIEMSCPLFFEMYDSIVKSLDSCPRSCSKEEECQASFSGDFSFAHAETLIPILNGEYMDANVSNELNAANYQRLKHDRVFKGGYFSPMGGNIMFATACPDDGIQDGFVMALLNEHPVSLPCCAGNFLNGNPKYPVCSKEQFIQCFSENALSCDFVNACNYKYSCNRN